MTDDHPTPSTARSPSHVAYHVRDAGPGRKAFWNRVGVAWANRDGGFTVQLDTLPLDGRVVCQPADRPADKPTDQPAE